jgi:uncharacterized protein YbjQ (UPF0145 family)
MSQETSPYRTGVEQTKNIIVTTTNDIVGHKITQYLGIVRGIVVRSLSIGQGFKGAFRSLGGGNIKEFTSVCEIARHEAYEEMIRNAESLSADAIIGMQYDATEFVQGATEVLAYGTAVKLEATENR